MKDPRDPSSVCRCFCRSCLSCVDPTVSFDISPQGFDVARSMLVRHKLVLLTRQADPEKA